jgi:hypothetical protein
MLHYNFNNNDYKKVGLHKMTNEPNNNYGSGWFVAIIVVLALLAVGYLVFAANV